jgi:hypothetical protein
MQTPTAAVIIVQLQPNTGSNVHLMHAKVLHASDVPKSFLQTFSLSSQSHFTVISGRYHMATAEIE